MQAYAWHMHMHGLSWHAWCMHRLSSLAAAVQSPLRLSATSLLSASRCQCLCRVPSPHMHHHICIYLSHMHISALCQCLCRVPSPVPVPVCPSLPCVVPPLLWTRAWSVTHALHTHMAAARHGEAPRGTARRDSHFVRADPPRGRGRMGWARVGARQERGPRIARASACGVATGQKASCRYTFAVSEILGP